MKKKTPLLFIGSAQYVVIVQYPIEEEKGSIGSSSLHIEHYQVSQDQ